MITIELTINLNNKFEIVSPLNVNGIVKACAKIDEETIKFKVA